MVLVNQTVWKGDRSYIPLAFRNLPGVKLTAVDPTAKVIFSTVDGSPMLASSGGTVSAVAAVATAAKAAMAETRRMMGILLELDVGMFTIR